MEKVSQAWGAVSFRPTTNNLVDEAEAEGVHVERQRCLGVLDAQHGLIEYKYHQTN